MGMLDVLAHMGMLDVLAHMGTLGAGIKAG